MPPENIDKRRELARLNEINEFLHATTSLLALPLYLAFWAADLLYVPHLKWQFLFLRAIIIPICLITNFSVKKCSHHSTGQIIVTLFILCNSVILTTMIYLAEGAVSPYYAGLNLVGSVLLYMPLTLGFLALNIFLLYGPFTLLGLFFTKDIGHWLQFGVSLFFIAAFLVIALVIRFFLERLRKRELEAQFNLEQELASREVTIREKAKETIRLTQLTRQFSPQVVQSIQSGKLSLDSANLFTICTAFIDAVGSTDNMNQIPLDQFNRVIGMFAEDTMKILLKYDITIDKFLGDGVLAFSNAPLARRDYIERMINATLELKQKLASRKEEYFLLWKRPFEVRIGIAVGPANVGFIGPQDSFKSYTAIGAVVNLASRLSDIAKPNEIYVSSSVARALSSIEFRTEKVGELGLKGFGEKEEVFRVVNRREDQPMIPQDIGSCPEEGHGVLHLDSDARGIYVFRCRICGYVSTGEETPQVLKKAA